MESIRDTLSAAGVEGHLLDEAESRLVQREDDLADVLRAVAANNGLIPEFVAEVLTNVVPLGSPVPVEQRVLVRANFVRRINEFREQQGLPPIALPPIEQ